MKLIKTLIIGALLVIIAAVNPAVALAIPTAEIRYVETYLSGAKIWQYDYTVFNTSEPDVVEGPDLWDLFFEFAPGITLDIVSVPVGWDYQSGSGFGQTYSQEPEFDIAPGESLGSFIFCFSEQVGSLVFVVDFYPPPEFYISVTSVSFPIAVPEPSTILLLAAGMGGLGLVRRRRFTARRAKGCA